ncbi:MAG: hypothetical protein KJN85_05805 [Maribacter sp.]|nr:hypothetical protein [Maribacter sp.]MBT8315109.1 hypothetical protein [Maribacter sp.]
MGMKVFMFVLFISFGMLNAQKVVKKAVQNPETSNLLIDANNCYQIDLTTTSAKDIVIEAFMDGEYKNDLLIKIEEDGPTIAVSAGFHPNFIKPNDKLSAHKVISIALKVQIPKNMKVNLFGVNANVYATGNYEDIRVTLDDGNCNFYTIMGMASATTQSGDIYVYSNGAIIETNTNFGLISNNGIPKGDNYFKLTTTKGNIYLRKTE